MKTRPFFLAVIMLVQALTARGEGPAAFGRRCIPAPPHGAQSAPWGPRADCVAPPSNIPDILGRHALSAGRLAALGATPDFHHGLLVRDPEKACLGACPRNEQSHHGGHGG